MNDNQIFLIIIDPLLIILDCQAVMVDKTLYISGQLGLGKDGHIVQGGTLAQAEQVIFQHTSLYKARCASVSPPLKYVIFAS